MKNLYILFASALTCLLFSNSASAQGGVVGFKETTNYTQEFKQITRTSDGGIIGVGSLGYGGRICKMNSSCIQQWSFGTDSVVFRQSIETNDGNYIVLGAALTTNYYGAPYIVKFDPSGNVLFTKMFYSGINNQLTAVGVCKAAGTDSGFVFYGGACVAMHYMIKCDKNGNVQWERQHVGLGNGFYGDMIAESSGYVADFNYNTDVGIVRMDALGNVTACKVFQGTNQVGLFPNSLAKKNNGDYYIWTMPSDSDGMQNYIVSNNFSTATAKRHMIGIHVDISEVIATGNANDDILICGIYSPGYAIYIKMNSSDAIVYQKRFTAFPSYFNSAVPMGGGMYALGGNTTTYGKSIAIVDENGTGVCAPANLTFTSHSYTFNTISPSVTNTTVGALTQPVNLAVFPTINSRAALCGSLSVDEQDMSQSVELYPNPSNRNVRIEFSAPLNGSLVIQVMGLNGNVVHTFSENVKEGKNMISLDLSGLADGIYAVQLRTEGYYAVKKVVKMGSE